MIKTILTQTFQYSGGIPHASQYITVCGVVIIIALAITKVSRRSRRQGREVEDNWLRE